MKDKRLQLMNVVYIAEMTAYHVVVLVRAASPLVCTSSSAITERPRDVLCLSVASRIQYLERSLLLVTSAYTTAYN